MLDLIGVPGAVLILLAFFLNQIHVWKSDSFIYEFTNLVGAAILAAYSWLLNSWPFLALNVIWGLVSLIEIVNMSRSHKPKKRLRGKLGHKRK